MEKKRYIYIDILNCLAIFSVLMLHSSQIAHFGNPYDRVTILGNVLQCIFIPAVYIFFMNSGAMLLNYRERQTTKTFAKKRFKRVVIPFVVWSILYYLYDMKWTAFPGPITRKHPGLKDFIYAFATNHINNIFWFFYAILAIYISLPIISLAVKYHKKYLWYIVVLSFILNDFSNWFGVLINVNLSNKYFNSQFLCFLAYAILGFLIKENFFARKQENLIIILGILSLFLSIIGVLELGKIKFTNFGPMLYSASVVLIVKRMVDNHSFNKNVTDIFRKAASSSLGMYILHVLFYKIFTKTFNVEMTNLVYIFVMPLVVYMVGTPLIYVVKRNKFIRMIIP